MKQMSVFALSILLFGTAAIADDWPQWMGPGRDGVWREDGVVRQVPADGLKVLWRTPVQGGYAGPAVADGRVFVPDYVRREGTVANNPGTRDELQGQERLVCLNAKSGSELWVHSYDRPYNISYGCGPRVTPAVDGDRVYHLGAEGDLKCLNVADGEVIWARQLTKDYKTETPYWGFSGHPLIDGDKLICLVGGADSVVVAFDKFTGAEIWSAVSASESGYCPPSIIEAGGVRQLIVWDPEKINSLNPETGDVYWTEPLKPDYAMSVTAPQKHGDYLYASGIGNAAKCLKLAQDRPAATLAWEGKGSTAVYCSNSTPLIVEDTIFGVSCRQGALRAVDLTSGDRLWENYQPITGGRRQGHGTAFLVRNDDVWYLFNEKGDLVLGRMDRDGFESLGTFHVLEPTGGAFGRDVVWTHPAFANRCLYARNDKEVVCVSLEAE
ncbi:MAG: PQQ-like beta-propeller repeat protein [Fuerstiella sp.]